MRFGFSTEEFAKKMKVGGVWGMACKYRVKGKKQHLNSTPKFRKNCAIGERMLLSQVKKTVESGYVKAHLDREELMRDFHLNKEQVAEILSCYYKLVNGWWNYGGLFKSVDDFFACLVTSDDVADYHCRAMDRSFGCIEQNYAMSVMNATRSERKECYYFCLAMTRLSGGDFYVGDGFLRLKSGYSGERYVQTVVDLGWFLAAKMLGTISETASPMGFFGDNGRWWEYNVDPMSPAYITKLMEMRRRTPGGVTTSKDIEDLFDDFASPSVSKMLLDGVIQKETYLDVKLLEWATRMKSSYDKYEDCV